MHLTNTPTGTTGKKKKVVWKHTNGLNPTCACTLSYKSTWGRGTDHRGNNKYLKHV